MNLSDEVKKNEHVCVCVYCALRNGCSPGDLFSSPLFIYEAKKKEEKKRRKKLDWGKFWSKNV